MSEIELYNALERMVKAAENNSFEELCSANAKFDRLFYREFGHLPNSTMDEKIIMYDKCTNSALSSVMSQPREEYLKEMKEIFSKIPQPL